MNIEIKTLHPTDAEWLHELHASCFTGTQIWSSELLATTLAKPTTIGLALVFQAQPVAFILLSVAVDEAEILTLAVNPAHRRQYFATQLLECACVELRKKNVKKIFLEVATLNEAAITLYVKHSFYEIGKRKNYYQIDGVFADALMLTKEIF